MLSLRRSLVLLIAILATASAAHGGVDDLNPGVFDPDEAPFGKSYGEWSAEWWQWALLEPTATNPILDTTGEFGGLNQAGDVWNLAGNFGGHTDRAVTVPEGKGILFPIVNALCWGPEDGANYGELLECAGGFFAGDVELEASVDGVPLGSLDDYRVASPPPPFPIVGGEVFGIDPGREETVSDGFFLMLEPLSVGDHDVDFRGFLADFDFEVSLHYDLTVVPEPSTAMLLSFGLIGLAGCCRYRRVRRD